MRRDAKNAKVTLIKRSEPFCGGCMIQQAQLDGAGIEYETIDITEQPEAIEEYEITTVPVTLVKKESGGTIRFDGFRPAEEIKEYL